MDAVLKGTVTYSNMECLPKGKPTKMEFIVTTEPMDCELHIGGRTLTGKVKVSGNMFGDVVSVETLGEFRDKIEN